MGEELVQILEWVDSASIVIKGSFYYSPLKLVRKLLHDLLIGQNEHPPLLGNFFI